MSFLVDTDICSAFIKGVTRVTTRFVQYGGRLHISTVTLGELYAWALRANASPKRLQSLLEFSKRPIDSPRGVPILRISAGTSRRDGIVDEDDHKYADVSPAELKKFKIEPRDLLACRFNGNLHFVGRFSLFVGYSGKTVIHPDKLIRFRLDESRAKPEYVRYAMNAADTRRIIESMCATTAGNIGISASRLKSIAIPVPALEVQHELVVLIDRLMALCDDLEAKLKQQRDQADRLAQAVVHAVVNGTSSADNGHVRAKTKQ